MHICLALLCMFNTEVKYAHAREWIIHFRATNQRSYNNMHSHKVQPLPPFLFCKLENDRRELG